MFQKSVLFILLFTFQFSQINAQSSKVTYQRNEDKSISFSFEKDQAGSSYVLLKFNSLTNASASLERKQVKGFSGNLMLLRPIDEKKGISFSYRARFIRGTVRAKPDYDFKYILPFKNGNTVKVKNLNYLGKKFGNKSPKNWRSFQFSPKVNDTVVAIRKGVVVTIKDGFKANTSGVYDYKSKANYIIIEHKDGTLARYSVLKANSFMVDVGDTVYPSTSLGIVGTYDTDDNVQLRLSVYYLDDKIKDFEFDLGGNQTLANQVHLYNYVDPIFFVNAGSPVKLSPNNEYMGFSSEDLIKSEMSKRELKQLKKGKLKIK